MRATRSDDIAPTRGPNLRCSPEFDEHAGSAAALRTQLTASEPSAWEIDSPTPAAAVAEVEVIASEPRVPYALVRKLSVDEVLTRADDAANRLRIICLPAGNVAPELAERAFDWSHAERPDRGWLVEANMRTTRAIASNTRAAIFGAAEQMPDAVDAILRFVVVARAISSLETAARNSLAAMQNDVRLLHAVTWRDQRQQSHVDAMTRWAAQMKIGHFRLLRALQQNDAAITSSKRLFSELASQAGLADRLAALEDEIQAALDFYEVAGTRLIEDRAAKTGFALEIAILIVLAAELAVMLTRPLL